MSFLHAFSNFHLSCQVHPQKESLFLQYTPFFKNQKILAEAQLILFIIKAYCFLYCSRLKIKPVCSHNEKRVYFPPNSNGRTLPLQHRTSPKTVVLKTENLFPLRSWYQPISIIFLPQKRTISLLFSTLIEIYKNSLVPRFTPKNLSALMS